MKTINSRFVIFSYVSTTVVAALACTVLLGWIFFDSPIKSMFPRNQLSNPVTAICFLLAVISFGLINQKVSSVRKIGRGIATGIILVALVKLSEILFHHHIRIDRWIFSDKLQMNGFEGKLNLMAPNTLLGFINTGIALTLSRYKSKENNLLADYFALGVTLISASSIIGYLYQAEEFYHVPQHMPMAFPTALCFLFLSLAILSKRSEFGFFSLFTTKFQGSKTARHLVPFAILIPVITGLIQLYAKPLSLSSNMTIAMFTVLNVILFLFVIWRSVMSTNKVSEALEAEREVRKLAEQKIYENQQLLKDLYDNAPAGYYSLDCDGVFINANLATISWLGYTKDELIGMRLTELLSPEDATRFSSSYLNFVETGIASEMEFYYRRKNGTTFPVLVNSSAVKDPSGKYLHSRSTINDITERKKSEKVIIENEKRLSTFFQAGPDAMVVISEIHEILEWNPKAEKIFGYTADEALGQFVYDLIIPDQYREAHKKGIERFLQAIDPPVFNRTVEFTALHKDGHEFFVNFSISNVKVNDKWIFISFIADITERKKLEQEIKQTNIFLNSILENIPLIVFVKDAKELKYVRLNKAGEKLIGRTESEIIGKSDHDFFPKETADLFKTADRQVLKNLCVLDTLEDKIHSSKGERWLQTKKIPILDENGQPLYLLGVSQDITEQKELQSVLKESNEKFLKIFYSSPLAMAIINNGTSIIMDVNEEYERLFGFRKEFLVGKTSADIGMIYDSDLFDEIKKKNGSFVSLQNVETTFYNSGKQLVEVIVSIETIWLGNTKCLIFALLDNTERKRLQSELTEINQELESFTYSVSHDLRAPLRIINGYAEMVKDGLSPGAMAEPRRMLENIIEGAHKMGTLIDDLLNFSKLGRKELNRHNTDMRILVKSILEKQLQGKPHYSVSIDAMPNCFCDSSLIKQVWENLISNAIKYAKNQQTPTLTLGSFKKDLHNVYYITDNGVGFDMKYYDKLFAVFQRLHKASEFEGTGVGLALSQRIISKHGGKIWAESKLNEGATFYFTVSKL